MEFKFVVAFAIIGISSAGILPAQQEYYAKSYKAALSSDKKAAETIEIRPKYEATLIGDIQNQAALSNGDIVKEGKGIIQTIVSKDVSLKPNVQRQPLHVKPIITPLKKKVTPTTRSDAGAYPAPAAYLTPPNSTLSITKSDLIYYSVYSPLKSLSKISSGAETYSAPASSSATKTAPVYHFSVPESYSPSLDSYSDLEDYLAPTATLDIDANLYGPTSYSIPSVEFSPLTYSVPASSSSVESSPVFYSTDADYYKLRSPSYLIPDDN